MHTPYFYDNSFVNLSLTSTHPLFQIDKTFKKYILLSKQVEQKGSPTEKMYFFHNTPQIMTSKIELKEKIKVKP